MSNYQSLADLAEVAPGTSKLVVAGDLWIGLFNLDGKIYATEARCPHAGAALTSGKMTEDTITCPLHAWSFRISDGKYLDEDCADCNLTVYPSRICQDKIEVLVPDNTHDPRAD